MKNIQAFIDDSGKIAVGPISSVACAATACNADQAPVMLVSREGETFNALFERLDNEITDEINEP